jgi:hypothetical protein
MTEIVKEPKSMNGVVIESDRKPFDMMAMLQRYRSRLINVSRRNRELYFKPSSLAFSLSEPLVSWFMSAEKDESESKQEGKSSAKFAPVRIADGVADALLGSEQVCLEDLFDLGFATKLPDGSTKDEFSKAEKKLERIRAADTRYAKEFGLTGAWLLGPFLCWRSAANGSKTDLLVSPLFRFPIDLVKSKQKGWTLNIEQSELAWNPSLRHALKLCWDIELPALDEDTFATALAKLETALSKSNKKVSTTQRLVLPKIVADRQAVKGEDGEILRYEAVEPEKALSAADLELYQQVTASEFQVIDCFWVSQINASRMVLVDDYDRMIDSDQEHSLIKSLLVGKKVDMELGQGSSAVETGGSISPVVSIDGSQHASVVEARRSEGLVIQGPPGTGKSQTIVNIIADSILRNERVLFVSEKRAALDVVHNRLEKAGIGSLAAILHSSDLDRSAFYQGFTALLKERLAQKGAKGNGLLNASQQLEKVEAELQSFREVLKAKSNSGYSISDLCAMVVRYGYVGGVRKLGKALKGISARGYEALIDQLPAVEKAIAALPTGAESWLCKRPELVATPEFQEDFKEFSKGLTLAIEAAIALYKEVESEIKIHAAGVPPEEVYALLVRLDSLTIQRCLLLPSALTERTSVLAAMNESDTELLARLREVAGVVTSNEAVFLAFKSDTTISEVTALSEYFSQKFGFFAFLNSTFRSMKRRARLVLQDPSKATDASVYSGFLSVHASLKQFREVLAALFIPAPKDADFASWLSLVNNLSLLVQSLVEAKPLLASSGAGPVITDFARLSGVLRFIESIRLMVQTAHGESAKVAGKADEYKAWITDLPTHGFKGLPVLEAERELLNKRLDSISGIASIDGVQVAVSRLSLEIGVPSLLSVVSAGFSKAGWERVIGAEIASEWFDEARVGNSQLRAYNREVFDRLLKEYADAEVNQRLEGQKAVIENAGIRCRSLGNTDGVALLKRESEKKRRLLTPREIMEKGALDEMLGIKPVWLMSPLSISQVLPFSAGMFDVVIFDEASQVPVEDALPSLYRAKRAILVGDRQQMPPTSFFSGGPTDDEEDDDGVESILDLAQIVLPEVTLKWHYRSKHHELISFSNSWFYKNSLVVPPSVPVTGSAPIEFVEVAEGTFNMSVGNRTEAKRVVEHLKIALESKTYKSIGIIAFGVSQQKAIEEVLEESVAADSKFAALVAEAESLTVDGADCGLFVKNLENVQGDERDCILLSVGYAPATIGGALRQQFGPLSQAGGGRRLNVAVTRALSKIVVFCSFNPEQILSKESAGRTNEDTALFGRYLHYAKAVSDRNPKAALMSLGTQGIDVAESGLTLFAREVRAKFESAGERCFTVPSGGGYFFDFARESQVNGSSAPVAVECDGVSLGNASMIRDRDLLRLQLLKARGWQLERIWPGEFALQTGSPSSTS